MTDTTKEIFNNYQVRRSKKQKANFREYVKKICESNNYEYNEEKGDFGARNIIIGNVDTAKVIYTAHYDTQSMLPIPYIHMPKKPLLSLLLQVLMFLGLFTILLTINKLICLLLNFCGVNDSIVNIVYHTLDICIWLWLICFPFFGITNKHTANDNTSGVTTLIDIMTSLPVENRQNVAFVFFDLEELGLWGSRGFANKHKNVKENTLVINFDCVSNGKKILFVVSKKASNHLNLLKESFLPTSNIEVEFISKGVHYPSDQKHFKQGIGVAALLKKGKIEYLSKIHSSKDTIYEEENIEYLVNGAKILIDKLNTDNK